MVHFAPSLLGDAIHAILEKLELNIPVQQMTAEPLIAQLLKHEKPSGVRKSGFLLGWESQPL
jgi:hypothetical protein